MELRSTKKRSEPSRISLLQRMSARRVASMDLQRFTGGLSEILARSSNQSLNA